MAELVVVMLDERLDLGFKITGQELAFQQDAVLLHDLMPALDLAQRLVSHCFYKSLAIPFALVMDFAQDTHGQECEGQDRAFLIKVSGTFEMATKPPLSPLRAAGSTIYVSGQLPRGIDGKIINGDAKEQTRLALTNLQRVLASVGLSLTDVVKVTAWITDAQYLSDFNTAYREFFCEPFPARSTVVSALVEPDAVVEIEAVAFAQNNGTSAS